MMLELYHNGMSSCAQKVRLVLSEKDLDWVGHHLDLRAGDTQTPAYLQLNPRGVVPTIVHDGSVIRESNVILEYLEDTFPEVPLRPSRPIEKAEMRLWLKRLDEGHHDIATATVSMGIAFRHQYLARGPEACEALIEKTPDPVRRARRRDVIGNGVEAAIFRTAVGMWLRVIDEMEATLGRRPWLAGHDYSIADAAWTPYITRLEHLYLQGLVEDRPGILDWYERIKRRSSYQAAMIDWFDPAYLSLMKEKGMEAWPRVSEIVAGFAEG